MDSRQTAARTAGVLYLIVVAGGIFSLAYVPSRIDTGGDPLSAVAAIRNSEFLFRLGIVAGYACYTAFLLLPLALYRLLSPVGRDTAAAMVALALASAPISFVNLAKKLDILSVIAGGGADAPAQVASLLQSYGNGLLVSEILWGLWLLPFGYLVFRSGFLPRFLGVLLMFGCFGYLSDFMGRVLDPDYSRIAFARFVKLPGSVGEIGACLWLLILAGRPFRLRRA